MAKTENPFFFLSLWSLLRNFTGTTEQPNGHRGCPQRECKGSYPPKTQCHSHRQPKERPTSSDTSSESAAISGALAANGVPPTFLSSHIFATRPPPPPSPDCCQAKIIAHKPRPSRRKELSLGKNQQQIDIQKQVHKSDQSSNPYKWFFARSSEFGEKGQPEMARSSLHQAPQVDIGL